jgi:simple sugar transport system permease protein
MELPMNLLTATAIAAVRISIPLLLAAEGETLSERSGVINVGMEGIMQVAAAAAFITTYFQGNPWIGVLTGMLTGCLFGLVIGFMCISLRANQIVVGIGVWLTGWGLASYLIRALVWTSPEKIGQSISGLSSINIPLLSDIPLVGPALFGQNLLGYMAFLLVPIIAFILSKTGFGLHVRAVGENPEAAEYLGVNVYFIRYICVVIGSALCGLAGAFLTVGVLLTFADNISAGRGFIAIAITMFGQWSPVKILGATLLFATADAVQLRLQSMYGWLVPYEIMLMLPYILTVVVVTIVAKKAAFPSALATPYIRKR